MGNRFRFVFVSSVRASGRGEAVWACEWLWLLRFRWLINYLITWVLSSVHGNRGYLHRFFLMFVRFWLLFILVSSSFYGNRCYSHGLFDGFSFLFIIYMGFKFFL